MEIEKTLINGVLLIKPRIFKDERGSFIKTFHKDTFLEHGLETDFRESFYTTSSEDVIRGMHFQVPPHEHVKMVYVSTGAILDVILDMRIGSPTYGEFLQFELAEENGHIVYIPEGCAHGFLSIEDDSCVVYAHSKVFAPDCDTGIRYDSFGFDWGIENPIVSKRDQELPLFKDFKSPFDYKEI